MLEALVISQILSWALVLSMGDDACAVAPGRRSARTDCADGRAYARPRAQGGRGRTAVRRRGPAPRHAAQDRRRARPQHVALLPLPDLPGVQEAAADREIDPA